MTAADDLGEPETGKRLFATALEKFGRIDTLVNAGVFIGEKLTDFTKNTTG